MSKKKNLTIYADANRIFLFSDDWENYVKKRAVKMKVDQDKLVLKLKKHFMERAEWKIPASEENTFLRITISEKKLNKLLKALKVLIKG